jgi:Trehalose and maltose hydrolases (possible phosphorylases)
MNTPYTHIGDYMERYWLVQEDSSLAKLLGVSIRLHIIKQPDQDRALHTHPFTFRTFILTGGYVEVRNNLDFYNRNTGTTYRLDKDTPHAILSLFDNEPAVSLFVYGQRKGDWYFDTDEGLVPHATYLNEQEKQNEQ